MRPVFDDEVARELGYQKYGPEWTDWAAGIGLVLLVLLGVWGIIMLLVSISGGVKTYKYSIDTPQSYYQADSYREENGCAIFESTKVCGTYTIRENK